MKVVESNNTFEQSENFESVEFDINKEARAHIFNVLRNQLYSDKILAVMREYSTNAVDAHVEVGKADIPIVITLPNQMEPTFRVRDFGRGLSEQEVKDIYSKYGESTKRATNDQIGQLGLGCKSAFAYGDNFVIVSYQNGTATTYNAFIDPSNVGRISKMFSAPTDEDNGIEIQIPVREDDIREFRQKAEAFFVYWKVMPVFRGQEVRISQPKVILEGDGWRVTDENYTGPVAIMGNIGYPLNMNAIKWTDKDRDVQSIIQHSVWVDFGIGDLEIAASREGLQYTDYTQDNIKDKLRSILTEIVDRVSKDFDQCKTVYEAKKLYEKLYDYGSVLYRLRHLFKHKAITVNGKTIDSQYYVKDYNEDGFVWRHYCHGRNGAQRVRPEVIDRIRCSDDLLIILNDVGKQGVLNRVAPIIELDPTDENNSLNKRYHNGVILININDQAKWDAWVKKNDFDAPTMNLSDLPKVKLADIYGATNGSGYVKNAKHGQKVFKLKTDSKSSSWSRTKSVFFETHEVDFDNEEGIYVLIDRFYVQRNGKDQNPYGLVDEINKTCKALGETVPEIVAVKVGKADSVNTDNFQTWDEWVDEKIKAFISKGGFEQQMVDMAHADEVLSERWVERLIDAAKQTSRKLPDDIQAYIDNHDAMRHDKDRKRLESIRELAQQYKVKIDTQKFKPTHDLLGEMKILNTKYKLLPVLNQSDFFGWDWARPRSGDKKNAILDYVELLDNCTALDDNDSKDNS